MKNRLFLLLLFVLCNCVGHAQHTKLANNFTLTGYITGKHYNVIWLRYPDINGNIIQQKATIKNNTFLFTGYIASPANAELADEFFPGIEEIRNYNGNLFISPGAMSVSLNGTDLSSAKITGSVMQDDWQKLEQQKLVLFNSIDSINKEMWKLSAAGNSPKNHKAHELLMRISEKYDDQLKQANYKFIIAHPNSYLSPYLTRYYLHSEKLSVDSARMFYKTFTIPLKQSVAGTLLQKELAK
jgi:hypothetical protein